MTDLFNRRKDKAPENADLIHRMFFAVKAQLRYILSSS